ncbi:hypothetical protein [Oryza sativa Japonica Group]|uniref:Uncharacterized protein OJ1126_G08.9 n=1 Tax=Oryza sativa subsp. japonica TaxID=39947 RepID=Q5VNI1_ORYSJ|nr:hypothetical protein [Oryza sativa Japonica Group]
MGRGGGAPRGGEADGAPAAFRERELADSGRKNLEKKTGSLGSKEQARRRGKSAEWRSGGDAGVRHDTAKPSVAVARSGGGGSNGGDRLEGVDGRRSSGARCGSVSEAETGKGVGARVWHGTAMQMVVAAWRDGVWSGSGVRLEARRRAAELGLARGEREKARWAQESWGNERGECGEEFYGRGRATVGWGDADSGRQPPAVWGGDVGAWRGKPVPFSWWKIGEMVEEVVGVQFHHLGVSGRGGVVRILRRSGRQWRPRAVAGEVAGGRGRS